MELTDVILEIVVNIIRTVHCFNYPFRQTVFISNKTIKQIKPNLERPEIMTGEFSLCFIFQTNNSFVSNN